MTLICFFFLLIIAAVLLVTDPKDHSNRWGSAWVLISAVGMIDIFIVQDVLPQITHNTLKDNHLKYMIEVLDNFLSTVFDYLFPVCLLMYGLSKNGIFYNKIKRKTLLTLIVFLPIIMITPFFPLISDYRNTYYTSFEIAINMLAIPYVLGGNFMLIHSFFTEENRKNKFDKLITCLIIAPTSLYILFMGYFPAIFNVHARYWLTIKWAALYGVIVFIISALRYGALGVKFRFERVRLDTTICAVSTGTAVLNHAIKNEVMNINICAKFIKSSNEKDEKITKYSETILNATDHMMAWVARIQEHTREIELEETPGNLIDLIEESLSRVDHYLQDRNIKVKRNYVYSDTSLLCDPVHMKEVLQNIFKNAIEAMDFRGELIVQIYQRRKQIILAIKDNGSGIAKQDLPHVVEPFFSTKGQRTNYGLGLTYCYNVMQKHGGSLQLTSEEGEGTTVFLNFPARKVV